MSAKCASDVEAFVRRHDEPSIASYFAVARLKEGAQARLAETVKETQWLWADVDFKDAPTWRPRGSTSAPECADLAARTPRFAGFFAKPKATVAAPAARERTYWHLPIWAVAG
jgi:hypothetical protein